MTSTKSDQAYLIDTHVFLWTVACSDRLSETARSILAEKRNRIFLSKASWWEICLKVSKGTLVLKDGWETIFERERRANRFTWLEIEPRHCQNLIALPHHHKDPFDRMLLSQATVEGLCLVSGDDKFRLYPVNLAW